MIQAAAVSTPQTGFFATIKSLFVSGAPGAGTRVRREPDAGERAAVQAIRDRVGRLIDTECSYSDEELVGYMVGNVFEPLQAMMRKVADQWSEPHLGRLALILQEVSRELASFDDKLTGREDFLAGMYGLDELHYNLGVLARGQV